MSKSESSARGDSLDLPGDGDTDHGSVSTPETVCVQDSLPPSPPPTYEDVLEETRLQDRPQDTGRTVPEKGPEIFHKSSKELYRAVAKQFGITCKMSDQCRCLDCQSHYFDCEYDQNEDDKTDGGLGAGTPMFISEVMHGTACSIL